MSAVLIPAHNEGDVLPAVLEAVTAQLGEEDRLVVVADNCDDNTADVARGFGAEVVDRQDYQRRGKGYALSCGVDYLRSTPPQVLVLLDADTTLGPGSLAVMVGEVYSSGKVLQARYTMTPPKEPSPKDLISFLAVTVKNVVRPLGLHRMGLPCPLTGSGIAMPWHIAESMSLDKGNIVEDMQLGLDLAIAGHPPRCCSRARATGQLPGTKAAATSQRVRWEHGHIQTLLRQTPRLIFEALRQRRIVLLAIGLDLAVPPLSLLCLSWAGAAAVAVIAGVVWGGWVPATLLGSAGILLATAVLISWARFAREVVPLRALLAVPLYILWKVPFYAAFLLKRQTTWVRTGRDAEPAHTVPEARDRV